MSEIPTYIRVAAKSLLCDLADHFEVTRSRHAPFWSGEETALLVAKAIMSAAPPLDARGQYEVDHYRKSSAMWVNPAPDASAVGPLCLICQGTGQSAGSHCRHCDGIGATSKNQPERTTE